MVGTTRGCNEVPGFKAPKALSLQGNAMKVELDRRSLFALASDTRLEILKALETNRRTVSQLADLLGIDKAAVHRHLKKLEEGGFVSRTEDHGFVYYALTWKSRDILNPNDRTKIVILISSSFVCLMAMIVVLYLAAHPGPPPPWNEADQEYTSDTSDGEGTRALPSASVDAATIAAIVLLGLAAIALVGGAVSVWRLPFQRGGEGYDEATVKAVQQHKEI
jgi:DNA-binding transcriptional ArsR family regulator